MAVTLVGQTTYNGGAGIPSLTVSYPAGTQAGDFILITAIVQPTGLTVNTANWQPVSAETAMPGGGITRAFYAIAGTETSVNLSTSSNSKYAAHLTAWRGVNADKPILDTATQNNASGTNVSAPAIKNGLGTLIFLGAVAHGAPGPVAGTPSSMTQVGSANTGGGSVAGNFYVSTFYQNVSAGMSDAKVLQITSADESVGTVLSIQEEGTSSYVANFDAGLEGWAATSLSYQNAATNVGGAIQANYTGGYSGTNGGTLNRQVNIATTFGIPATAKILGADLNLLEKYVSSTNETAMYFGAHEITIRNAGTTAAQSLIEAVIPRHTIDKSNLNFIATSGSLASTPRPTATSNYDGTVGTTDINMVLRYAGDFTKTSSTATLQWDNYALTLRYSVTPVAPPASVGHGQLVGVPL